MRGKKVFYQKLHNLFQVSKIAQKLRNVCYHCTKKMFFSKVQRKGCIILNKGGITSIIKIETPQRQ